MYLAGHRRHAPESEAVIGLQRKVSIPFVADAIDREPPSLRTTTRGWMSTDPVGQDLAFDDAGGTTAGRAPQMGSPDGATSFRDPVLRRVQADPVVLGGAHTAETEIQGRGRFSLRPAWLVRRNVTARIGSRPVHDRRLCTGARGWSSGAPAFESRSSGSPIRM